ncbi:MAG: hypothetical protein ACP5LW_02580, partial [Nitrososphaeria archaeon]
MIFSYIIRVCLGSKAKIFDRVDKKAVVFALSLLFIFSSFVMPSGNFLKFPGHINSSAVHSAAATSGADLQPSLIYRINRVYYYNEFDSMIRKVIPSVNGFYVIGNDIILFKSPNLQEPLKTTPGWGYFYSDIFVDRFGILANGSIYILGNGMYYKGGGGLFIWKISVNGNVLTDISSILPPSWTVPGNNMFWLTGAYGNGTLALAEDNFNQTECNIILIRNNAIVATIKDPLGYTGSNQQPSMAFADGQFLFLVQDNGKILAALISQDGSVTDVSSHFNYIQMINPDSDLLGIGKVFVIAAGSTYIFNPSTGDLISVNNPAQVGITSYFNSTCVLLGGVESQNFTVELMNL